ncbi:phosphonate C-P lyase system protein PhnH [uncultured Devosia sp.]|uniref:phosphonate C-P lyase system protein PhnH n=1 Tax=uncultured Devosia sp. TaxID=211434 RepID=UPI0035CB1651
MLTIAPPDMVEVRANATFEALMWAMARPGDGRHLPDAGLGGLIETLVDLECTVFTDEPELRARATATGARLSDDPGDADHVFVSCLDDAEQWLITLRCGNALYPDDGATLGAVARHGIGQRLRLSGPGIDGSKEAILDVSPAFWAMRARLCAYPEGFDMLVVDGRSVIGIPRSTQVEVL